MAQVTMELRDVLKMTNFTLFDFDYPCDDAAWKTRLEEQFVEEFYFMEIGQETIDRWKHRVMTRFKSIMPYYNALHNSESLALNPFITHRRTENYDSTNASASEATALNDTVDYEHPQTGTSSDIPAGRVNNDGTSTSSSSGSVNYEKIIEGLDGDQNALLKAYRDNILRINGMIMRECKDLFILVY